MDGALSGKTGFTSKAGYCYVGALERDGKCFIVALLACGWPGNKTWKWEDTRKLMEYGLSSFEYRVWYEPPKLPKQRREKNNQNADGRINFSKTKGNFIYKRTRKFKRNAASEGR